MAEKKAEHSGVSLPTGRVTESTRKICLCEEVEVY